LRWLLGCLAVGLALRLFRIGHQNLWIDEMISLQMATWSDNSEFWRGLLRDIHGPLTTVFLRGWLKFGDSEAWMRLLYAIPAVATIPLVQALATRLFDARTGRLACLFAAVSPFHVWYSQEVRNYTWAILWITGALVLFLKIWDGEAKPRAWLLLSLILLLAVLTNFSTVFLLIALTALIFLRRPFSPRLTLQWGAALGFVTVAFLPWFLDWFSRIGAERLFVNAPSPTGMPLREASGVSLAGLPYIFWTFSFGYTLGPTLLELHLDRSLETFAKHLPVLSAGALAISIGLLSGIRTALERGRGAVVLALILVPTLLAVVLAAREIKTFHPRYLVAFFPVFLAVLAGGFSRKELLARASLGVAGLLVVFSLAQHYFDPSYAKEDSRSAARHILAREVQGDAVVVIYSFRPFRHYFADLGSGKARLIHTHKRFLRTEEDLRGHAEEARAASPRVWLVLSRWWEVAPELRIRKAFEATLEEKGLWEFPGTKVLLYERRQA
jgi:uncharacterized membrane protein